MAWNDEVPEDIDVGPAAFKNFKDRINYCLSALRALSKMEGKAGVKVEIAGENVTISGEAVDGLPDGYGPEEFTICDSGSPVTRNFITDNPD